MAGLTSAAPLGQSGPAACEDGFASGFPCRDVDLVSWMPKASLGGANSNDNWGWTSPAGVEYALVGASHGLAIFELGRQSAVATVTYGGRSYWRDVKVYNGHAFVVSEATAHGLAVFDLSRLETEQGDLRPDVVYGDFAAQATLHAPSRTTSLLAPRGEPRRLAMRDP